MLYQKYKQQKSQIQISQLIIICLVTHDLSKWFIWGWYEKKWIFLRAFWLVVGKYRKVSTL